MASGATEEDYGLAPGLSHHLLPGPSHQFAQFVPPSSPVVGCGLGGLVYRPFVECLLPFGGRRLIAVHINPVGL